MRYYPNLVGPLQSTNIGYVSWSRIEESWASYAAEYTAYSSRVSAYEVLREDYNKEVAADAIRRATPLSLFTTNPKLVNRPCPPDQPPAY